MKRTEIILLLFLSIFSLRTSVAVGNWDYFMDGNYINDFTLQGGRIYCATRSGLVIWNRHDIEYTYRIERFFSSKLCCVYQRNNFTTVAVNTNGTVWCGSSYNSDLYSFDGNDWTVCTPEESGLKSKAVSLYFDRDDVLWISTDNGIVRYNGNSWTSYTEDTAGHNLEKLLGIDRNNVKWFRTDSGVSGFNGTTWEVHTEESGMPSGTVIAMSVGIDTIKWFSHGSFISRFDDNTWSTFEMEEMKHQPAVTLVVDDNDTVWCGTYANGLYRFNVDKWNHFTAENSALSADTVNSMCIDSNGTLWISHNTNLTQTGTGLTRFDGISWSNLLIDGPLSYSIQFIAVDNDNTKWFGTYDKGLSSFDGTLWHSYTMADTVRIMDISGIGVDNNNVLWMGYMTKYEHPESSSDYWFVKGILSYDGMAWTKYPQEVTGLQSRQNETDVDHDNVKWFSFSNATGGIASFDDHTWLYYPRDGLDNKFGRPIAVDHNNIKWFGSAGGVTSFDGNNWEHYELPGDKRTRYMDIDHNNVKWILSDYHGVYSLEGSQLDYHGLPENIVNLKPGHDLVLTDEVVVDSRGVKWFIATEYNSGLAGVGLLSFDGETWTYHRDDFWFTNNTRYLKIDHNDVKWLSGTKGISRYDGDANGGSTTEVLQSESIPENVIPQVNYPNPFNHSTTLTFILEDQGFTTLCIYNASGQKVRELLAEQRQAGRYTIRWDGLDNEGLAVSSGVYFSGVTQGKRTGINRMLLIK